MNSPSNKNRGGGFRPFLHAGILFFTIAMLPVWPVEGKWFGLPAWVIVTALACLCCSCFIAWGALKHWPDLEGDADGD